MTSQESARHSLYARLEELLGHENADTLMTSFPHSDSDHLATRDDVVQVDRRIESLEHRFDRLESKLDQQIRTYTVTTVGAMTGLTAIFGVIVSILG
jgi:Mg2+ and Co2+ transporter CorA